MKVVKMLSNMCCDCLDPLIVNIEALSKIEGQGVKREFLVVHLSGDISQEVGYFSVGYPKKRVKI